MEFRLLGPLEVLRDGVAVTLGGPRERAVLAALLLRANEVAGIGYLVDAVWDRPPASPETNLRTYLSGLRRRLDPARIHTHPSGYRFEVRPGELDVAEFDEACADGRKAPDAAGAATAYGRALALWRDDPLLGLQYGDGLRAEVTRLTDRRIDAVEGYARARLDAGGAADLVDELARFTGRIGGREELWALLIEALHRAGRRAEALETYTRARTRLVEQLGVEPGPRLQALQATILRGEPVESPEPPSPRPAQLPTDLSTFTGRHSELDRLKTLLAGAPRTVVISAIDGMAGIGKTSLAVHFAHHVRDRYPDGQLFLDLHGHTEGIVPVEPRDALTRLLAALGVRGEQLPAAVEDRAGLYRSLLADKRMLILLDNAASERQVRPLLPSTPGCTVLITSRRRLAALDDAIPLSLDVLPAPDAEELFHRIAGPDRTAEPAELVRDVVELCGHLPLAIRIAAARLRSRPGWTTAHLADRLGDLRKRLPELRIGERGVAAAFALSYRDLDLTGQRTFRLLGLHPGADIDTYAAAALAGAPVERTGQVLEHLVDAHLLMQRTPDRFTLHDLMRAHAADTAADEDTAQERTEAVNRLLDHLTYTASTATRIVYPSEGDDVPVSRPGTAVPELDIRTAVTWLAAELPNLLSAAGHAAANGRPRHAIALSRLLSRYVWSQGHHDAALILHTEARDCARRTGDEAGELHALLALGDCHLLCDRYGPAKDCYLQALAVAERLDDPVAWIALHGLGNIYRLTGEPETAQASYRRSLEIVRRIGDRTGQTRVLRNLGLEYATRSRHPLATECFQQALEIAEEIGDRGHQTRALVGLAVVCRRTGELDEALGYTRRALEAVRQTDDRAAEVNVHSEFGRIALLSGRLGEALEHSQQALDMARGLGDRLTESQVLKVLGDVHDEAGRAGRAVEHYRLALDIARQIDNPEDEFEALHRLGRVLLAAGRADEALDHHARGLELIAGLGQLQGEAKAHDGLAAAYEALGRPEPARIHWQRAYDLYRELGLPRSEQIAGKLG